jgi:hypothetical protein
MPKNEISWPTVDELTAGYRAELAPITEERIRRTNPVPSILTADDVDQACYKEVG